MASPRTIIAPQGGPTSPQSLFLRTTAQIAIFAGMPGSGKSAALTLDMMRGVNLPLFRGAAFRRQATQLTGGGSLWDLATRWFPHAGAELVSSPKHMARFPSGATIEFHHLNQESDKEAHDGKSYEALVFDELPHFSAAQWWYLMSRNRGVSGYRPTVRASTMPAPNSWVHELVKPWLDKDGAWPDWSQSGRIRWFVRNPFNDEIVWFEDREVAQVYIEQLREEAPPKDPIHETKPKSFTVVHALTADNAILKANSAEYDMSTLTRYDRERLSGNWQARLPSAGMFDRAWFKVLDAPPRDEDIVFSARGWDRAATLPSEVNKDPDWTRGVRLDLLRNGMIVIRDVVSLRDRPGAVNALIAATARLDGPRVTQAFWINPGDSGQYERDSVEAFLKQQAGCGPLVFKQQTANKEAYARPCATFFDPEIRRAVTGAVVRAAWNAELFSEAEMFPLKRHPGSGEALHDDIVDAMSRAFIEFEGRRVHRAGLSGWSKVSWSAIRSG